MLAQRMPTRNREMLRVFCVPAVEAFAGEADALWVHCCFFVQ